MTSAWLAGGLIALVSVGTAARQDRAAPLPRIETAALPAEARDAIDTALAAAREHPGDADRAGRLGIVLHAWEQWDAAAAAYARARALTPGDTRWWYLAGLLETARGRHRDAVPFFERVVADTPADRPGRLRLAEARLESGDLDGSRRLFEALASDPATLAPAEYGLGRIAAARGDQAAAAAHFEQATAAFPDYGAAHYALALAYRRLGRADAAAEALRRQQACLACWPALEDPLAQLVPAARDDGAALLKRGMALAREGRDDEAIEAHERALERTPALAQAHLNLVTLYGRTRQWTKAKAHYEQALSGEANAGEAHASYAYVLLAEGRAADAVTLFRKALAANAGNTSARNGLGLALETTGDREGAAAEYRRAAADAPAFRAARFNYGRMLVALGQLPAAVDELEKLQTPVDEETPRYLFALSAAVVRSGDRARGRGLAEQALQLARQYGQRELVASIERDLARLR